MLARDKQEAKADTKSQRDYFVEEVQRYIKELDDLLTEHQQAEQSMARAAM